MHTGDAGPGPGSLYLRLSYHKTDIYIHEQDSTYIHPHDGRRALRPCSEDTDVRRHHGPD